MQLSNAVGRAGCIEKVGQWMHSAGTRELLTAKTECIGGKSIGQSRLCTISLE